MDIPRDFVEFGGCFNANKVRFLIVGAFAFGYHLRPRATKDIDFWIEPTPTNADRTLTAIREFGFRSLNVSRDELARPGLVLILGIPPKRIDVVTSIRAVRFPTAWRHRCRGHLGDTPVWFLGRRDLIRNKRAVDRPQDRADVAYLTKSGVR